MGDTVIPLPFAHLTNGSLSFVLLFAKKKMGSYLYANLPIYVHTTFIITIEEKMLSLRKIILFLIIKDTYLNHSDIIQKVIVCRSYKLKDWYGCLMSGAKQSESIVVTAHFRGFRRTVDNVNFANHTLSKNINETCSNNFKANLKNFPNLVSVCSMLCDKKKVNLERKKFWSKNFF